MYCIERSVNISITRIIRVKNIYVAITDDISVHTDFFRLRVTMVAGYLLINYPHS